MDTPQLSKTYDPQQVEQTWYSFWEAQGFFHADENDTRDAFCIVIPPPNVTGSLHMGHALNNTLQDILVRYRRMDDKNALWIPGTDHAGIATQYVVEKELAQEKKTRKGLGREKFIERIWQWRRQHGGIIIDQLRRLGASCDWDRERFTLDEGLSKAVREAFVSLFEDDLIYRGDYIISWCPRCHTALSDLEVDYQETQGNLYFIHYPLTKGKKSIVVATTRPETMLGDTAVAVNPEDERYRDMIGKEVILPLTDRVVPVIADEYVDRSFGTGALKITPAHDASDFEIGARHNLPSIKVIDDNGKMNENAGRYRDLDRIACRERVIEDLKNQKLLKKVEKYAHNVGHCYRCNEVVEPTISKQWFLRVGPLAKPALDAVRQGKTRIIPSAWEKTYYEWMENIRDWCISRQIWWGHRIPAWYCRTCGELLVAREDPQICKSCGSSDLFQESDVLDTWFSSSLWPFSTLGWPIRTKELERFYPTSVLVTGFDILFFWVARMMMMGLKFMGDVPFRDVYIHALVRDSKGQKMSKSLGNVIDPLVMIDKYGADAFRFTLAALAAQGRDIKLSEDIIAGYQHFANKLWNASRFVLLNLDDYDPDRVPPYSAYPLAAQWILSRANRLIKTVRAALDSFKFNEAASALYQFTWHEFCDWYVELSKVDLGVPGTDETTRRATQCVLVDVLNILLKLLHPFMPFVTEEIWQKLPGNQGSIMISEFPKVDSKFLNTKAEEDLDLVKEIIYNIRNIRGEMNIPPSQKADVILVCSSSQGTQLARQQRYLIPLAFLKSLAFLSGKERPKAAATAIIKGVEIYIPLAGLINFGEEESRIKKEIAKVEKDLLFVSKKLSNEDFLLKAPQDIVEKERQRRQELIDKQNKLNTGLNRLISLRDER